MLADTPIEQRESILRDSCDQIVERSYMQRFSIEETNLRRAELAEVAILADDLEQELSRIKTEYRDKIKPLYERIAKIRTDLKSGGEWVKGNCYKFIDEDEGMTGYYSPEGYLLEQRPMTPEEGQRNVFRTLRRTGTDN